MYIGLDVGTSSVKAVLFSQDGQVQKKASKAYPVHGEKGNLELNPLEVRDAAFYVLRKMGEGKEKIRTIGISSLGEAAVLIGRDGNVLERAILPGDVRGTREAEALENKDDLSSRTGLPVNGTYTVCKLLWMRRHRPDIYSRISRVMLFGDYLGWCLTGEQKIGHSLASRTMAYDLERKQFFAAEQGIDPEWFSEPVDADACVGRILPECAAALHLPEDTLIFAGGHDQPCAAVGTGALQKGWASDSIGTSECITVNLGNTRLLQTVVEGGNFANEPFLQTGVYDTMAYTHTAGRLVEWLYQKMGKGKMGVLDRECEGAADPTGLLVLPHFSGSGTPCMDPLSTGAIVGLNLHTDLELLHRAVLENVCYEMKQNLRLWEEHGIKCSRIVAVGGGTRSRLWLQYKANIYQMPIYLAGCGEASALGAAIASAKGIGDFKTWEQAASAMVTCRKACDPKEEKLGQFEETYEKYSRLYGAVKEIYR